ncbi:MAG TPA: hypothetical protein VGE15_07760 [Sphingobacteriaceae bacterium]
METREIIYELNGESCHAQVQLLSPAAWIFVVRLGKDEPFHLEYEENSWAAIEEGQDPVRAASIGEALMNAYGTVIPRTVGSREPFFIMSNENEEIICSWDADLRIRVSASTEGLGLGDLHEKVYFGSCPDGFRAFQTIDYRQEDALLVEQAIAWYTSRKADTAQAGPAISLSLN